MDTPSNPSRWGKYWPRIKAVLSGLKWVLELLNAFTDAFGDADGLL